jgi:hypothetical protein
VHWGGFSFNKKSMNENFSTTGDPLASVLETPQTEQSNQPGSAEPQTPTDAASIAAATVGRRGRKPGRHKRDCTCPKCLAKKDSSTVDPSPAEPESAKVVEIVTEQDRQICRETIKAVTHTIDCVTALAVDAKCTKAKIPARKATEFVQLSQFKPEIRDGIVTTGTLVAEKHGCIKILPEISLIGFLVAHIGCIVKLCREIDNLAPPIDVEATVTPDNAPGTQKQS